MLGSGCLGILLTVDGGRMTVEGNLASVLRRPSNKKALPPLRAKGLIPSVVPPQFLQTKPEALGSLYRAARTTLLCALGAFCGGLTSDVRRLSGNHTGMPLLRGAFSRWPSISFSLGRLLFSVTVCYK